MKTALLVLGSLLAGAVAQSTAPCPDGVELVAPPSTTVSFSVPDDTSFEIKMKNQGLTCDSFCEFSPAATSAPAATPTEDDQHIHEPGSRTLHPSPTNSGECHTHGGHWNCEGTAGTDVPAVAGRIRVGMAAIAAFAAFTM